MPAESVRPALRSLREDLELAVPTVTRPLDEIGHPLLRRASERFGDLETPHERIRSIGDQILFKAQRWRGAVWVDQEWLAQRSGPTLLAAVRSEATSRLYEGSACAGIG